MPCSCGGTRPRSRPCGPTWKPSWAPWSTTRPGGSGRASPAGDTATCGDRPRRASRPSRAMPAAGPEQGQTDQRVRRASWKPREPVASFGGPCKNHTLSVRRRRHVSPEVHTDDRRRLPILRVGRPRRAIHGNTSPKKQSTPTGYSCSTPRSRVTRHGGPSASPCGCRRTPAR
jgi:hypothetical protein